jgi:hypothetical protein
MCCALCRMPHAPLANVSWFVRILKGGRGWICNYQKPEKRLDGESQSQGFEYAFQYF